MPAPKIGILNISDRASAGIYADEPNLNESVLRTKAMRLDA